MHLKKQERRTEKNAKDPQNFVEKFIEKENILVTIIKLFHWAVFVISVPS